MSNLTLRGQLMRASMATTLVALLLSSGALLVYEWVVYRGALIEDLRSQADLIAYSTASALVFNDPRSARENLALLQAKPSIRSAAIFTSDGQPFATYVANRSLAAPAAVEARLLADGSRFNGSILQSAYSIRHDREVIGTVYLEAEHDVWLKAGTFALIGAAAALASLALAYLVFGRLQRIVTDPLVRMTNVAQEVMERRDWTLRAPPSVYKDITVLIDAFNGMLAEVESRTGGLEREMVERQHAEAGLREADRKKDEFLATLAHELRNPLAPMTNAVALIRRPAAGPEVREKATGIIDRQLKHMVRLIDDLLDVSRVATGKLSLREERIDLAAVLRAAVELAEPLASSRRLTISADLPQTPCRSIGDSARLLQVFSNILNNACRYTPGGGRIDVVMTPHADNVEVAIRDTGIGIAADMQHRIFDLFEQGDKSLERGNTGLGIGLTLARQLVQLHRGDISVRSDGVGQGACFTVRLPLPALPDAAVVQPAVRKKSSTQGLRLLVADDNVDSASTLQVLLDLLGHDVVVANDGQAALDAAMRELPDVAILDIGMPGLNGYEVARRLRAERDPASLGLIAITGWGQASDKETAAAAGFDHHLVKPVAPEAVIDLLAVYQARKASRAELQATA